MIKDGRVVITGGAGFIGSTLARQLVAHNDIVLFDNMSRNALDGTDLAEQKAVELIKGDVRDAAAVEAGVKDATHVIHCAAIAGIDTVVKSPVTTMEVNMLGSANVLRAASQVGGIERVVCFSTSEVFGSRAFNSDETDNTVIGAVGEARWTYAVSKLAEEHLANAYYREMGLPVSIIRPFNVYGPGQVGEGALRTFVLRALGNETLEIHGDGTQIRAWCFIDDVVRGTLACLEHPNAVGEAFNIGNQRAVVTIYGLANTVIRVLGSRSKLEFVRKDYADVELRIPRVDKARDRIGFEALIDLDEGIARTAEFYRRQMEAPN